MQSPEASARCPRCDANLTYRGPNDMGTVSRTTRDDGAEIHVCARCGLAEALRGVYGLRMIGFDEWPLEIDDLLTEEMARILQFRRSTFGLIAQSDLDVIDFEADDEDGDAEDGAS
jgi:uncharacterized C2H2 Zn-finger protein